jgi:uncharacterized delta-60 repeat protein
MKTFAFHRIAGLLAVGALFSLNFAQAQAGTLDPTFGNGGTVTTSFPNGSAAVGGFEQSNGDIVAVAQVDFVENEGTGIGLVRYTSTGALDTTFGTNGITNTTFAGFTFTAFGFAVQTNGDILVAGEAIKGSAGQIQFGLARYTSNGILDATFGNSGLVTTIAGTRVDVPTAMLLQPNGKIVMAGFEVGQEGVAPGNMSMVRYNSNGSLDTTFGTGGISLVTDTITGPDALALLSNGDYLAVGQNGGGKTGIAVELNSKGVLLAKVTAGTLTSRLSSSQSGFSPTIFQSNGDYIVAVTTCTNDSQCRGHKIGVSRFLETGKVDTSFNANSFESFDPPATTSVGTAMALQANGQIVVGGLISPTQGGMARLDANGELDLTFGTTNSFGGCCTVTSEQTFTGLLIQTDGNIVAIGELDGDLALARYLAN